MQVGSLRENIVCALLIHRFGEENVNTNIPITKPETDVELFNQPVSIKTKKNIGLGGVKLIWTVDAQNAKEFQRDYYPECDLLFVHIIWDNVGGLYYIPVEVQREILQEIGRANYIKLPKEGTNPRGVEITKEALASLINNAETKKIQILWKKRANIKYTPYERWVEYWREE